MVVVVAWAVAAYTFCGIITPEEKKIPAASTALEMYEANGLEPKLLSLSGCFCKAASNATVRDVVGVLLLVANSTVDDDVKPTTTHGGGAMSNDVAAATTRNK